MSEEKKSSATLAEVLSSTAATLAAVKEMQEASRAIDARLAKVEGGLQTLDTVVARQATTLARQEKLLADHANEFVRQRQLVQGAADGAADAAYKLDKLDELERLQAQLGMRLHELEDRSSFEILTPAAKVGVTIGGFMALIVGGAAAVGLAGRVFDAARGADGVARGHELQRLALQPSPVVLADGRVIDRDGVVPTGTSGGELLGAAALGAIVGASAAN